MINTKQSNPLKTLSDEDDISSKRTGQTYFGRMETSLQKIQKGTSHQLYLDYELVTEDICRSLYSNKNNILRVYHAKPHALKNTFS